MHLHGTGFLLKNQSTLRLQTWEFRVESNTYVQANNTARELQKRVEQLERINIELKTRLEETSALYEQTQRDLRNKQAELQRVGHELEKTREQKDSLTRENKKLSGVNLQQIVYYYFEGVG